MVKIKEFAPLFTLKNEHNEDVSLASFRGKKVILYFYPKDFTSGCTVQAECFSEFNNDFAALGYQVIGVSKDTVVSHRKFSLKYDLGFTLLADPKREVITMYGLVKEATMYGKKVKGTRRSTFIINEEGIITDIFYDVDPHTSTKELLTYLKAK